MTYLFSCRLGALAGAAALVCTLAGSPAYALGLGRITVQSALGEALRAEIEVPQITADEAASLRVSVASADAFKAAGLDYTTAVVGIQVSLQKRPDGRSFLRLSSPRPVTEPFIDLILDANWASGRVVRDYTMLFDPPNLRQAAAPVAPTAPVLSRPAAPPTGNVVSPLPNPISPTPTPTPPPSSAQASVRPAPVARVQPQPAAAKPVPVAPAPASSGQKVAVKPGDTASKIAAQNKPASISLDQMLVALLKTNPDAFIGGNINRLKSGALLDIPAAEDAGKLLASEASSTIITQAKDFNAFRQKLASGAPAAQVDGATRQAGGKVQAKVEDRAAVAATPDKLTLSKGAVQGNAATEDKIAKDKQAAEATTRVAELSKNLADLNKIAGVAPAAAGNAAAVAASTAKPQAVPLVPLVPGVKIAAGSTISPALTGSAATGSATAASAPASAAGTVGTSSIATLATTPVAATSTTAVVQPAAAASASVTATSAASPPVAAVGVKPIVTPPSPAEPSLIDELSSNPLVLPGLGLLLALLAGFGFYRYKKRNDQSSVDSSFLESRLQPDSFFGASGGQRIDTSEGGNATGSSLVYSSSQLDAAGDVDPVAEADVYLAYGRDLQAEEILKEALRTNSSRVAIHAKLMEIYAKRRDLKSFESVAADAFALTGGQGSEWVYISELGRDLDPTNTIYQPGNPQPSAQLAPELASDTAVAHGTVDTMPQMLASKPASALSSVDFDLDLDFSAPAELASATASEPVLVMPDVDLSPEYAVTVQGKDESAFDALDMDFGDYPAVAANSSPAHEPLDNSISFNLDPLPLPVIGKATPTPAAVPAAAADIGMLEFDMGSLSLDLDAPVTQSPSHASAAYVAASAVIEGPLETKFALAEEFRALGDADGARSLVNEVLAQAQGSLKSKAQAFLNALS